MSERLTEPQRDSEAVMAHLTNMGETIGRFSELTPATRIGYWTGFTR